MRKSLFQGESTLVFDQNHQCGVLDTERDLNLNVRESWKRQVRQTYFPSPSLLVILLVYMWGGRYTYANLQNHGSA